jgi:hypothetical protein
LKRRLYFRLQTNGRIKTQYAGPPGQSSFKPLPGSENLDEMEEGKEKLYNVSSSSGTFELQANLVNTLTLFLIKIHFNIIL